MKKSLFAFMLLALFMESCNDESTDNASLDSVCDQVAIVNQSRYTNTEPEGYTITSIQLVDDCLEVEIQAGGCSGDTWKVDLIDSGSIAESNPEQRYLKISLDNPEICLAVISKTFTFDIKPLQISRPTILLNLALWDEQIRYAY